MDELVERVARLIAPNAWLSFDERCERKEFTPEEMPGELAEWLAAHPHGAMAGSIEKARAIIPIVQADQRERDAGIAEVAWQSMCGDWRSHTIREGYGKAIATAIRKGDA